MSSPVQLIWFDPTHIIKEGYLTKSLPLDIETLIRKRWRLRWFVLCYVGAKPTLYYFKNEKYRKQSKPKGKISLVDVEVFKQRTKMNGYSFIINVQTEYRLYHLCSTQQEVHQEWLEALNNHHMPNTEIKQRFLIVPKKNRKTIACLVIQILDAIIFLQCRHLSPGSLPYKTPLGSRPSASSDYVISATNRSNGRSEDHKDLVETTSRSRKGRSSTDGTPSTTQHQLLERPKTLLELAPEGPHQRRRAETQHEAFSFPIYSSSKCYDQEHIDVDKGSNVDNIPGELNREKTDYMLNSNVDFSHETADSVFGISSKQCKVEAAADVQNLENREEGCHDIKPTASTSTTTLTTTRSPLTNKLFEDAMRVSRDDNNFFNDTLRGRGFVGPRITTVTKKIDLRRTYSAGEVLDH